MKKTIMILLAGILLTTGCVHYPPATVVTEISSFTPPSTRTPKPTKTPFPTRTSTVIPSKTSTYVPTFTAKSFPPLVSHDFKPSPILATYSNVSEGFCDSVCPAYPVPFVLFGDGNLFIFNEAEINGHYEDRFLHKKLDRSETCRFLNTIDQVGFFDFNSSSYAAPKIYDAYTWRIEIYAWRTKDVSLYGLGELLDIVNLDHSSSDQTIPASALRAFNLLYNYPTDGLDTYIPNLLVIWVWKSSYDYPDVREWKMDDISLKKLYEKGGSAYETLPHPIFLDGSDAKNIYAMFDNFDYHGDVTQAGERYRVYIRPVLPFEKITKDGAWLKPDEQRMNLPNNLHCSPLDGTMPILPFGRQ
ncbi:MAG: hypothetical protein QM730_29630 [Anaerolineales bacterium]